MPLHHCIQYRSQRLGANRPISKQITSTLNLPHQTLENWQRFDKVGKLKGVSGTVFTLN